MQFDSEAHEIAKLAIERAMENLPHPRDAVSVWVTPEVLSSIAAQVHNLKLQGRPVPILAVSMFADPDLPEEAI